MHRQTFLASHHVTGGRRQAARGTGRLDALPRPAWQWGALALVLLATRGLPLHAQRSQVIPQGTATPGQATGALESELRARLEGSGLSLDQVRARLRAAGYAESLLDGVLGRAGGGSGATLSDGTGGTNQATLLEAVRALGVVDSADVVRLQQVGRREGLDADTTWRRSAAHPDSGFVLFGHELFKTSTSRFQPNLDAPVDEAYPIGPGDRLVLILTGGVEAAYTLEVTREGFVVIPQAGRVDLGQLTLGQAERLVQSRLARVYQGVGTSPGATTRLSLSVARLKSIQVVVTGDVAIPGAYRVSGASTILTALYAAGGPTANGSLRAVELRRGGRRVGTMDVYDYLLRGDASRDLRLQQGDIIHVPVHGPRARLAGAVIRPAIYEVAAGESLIDVVRAAGGLRPTATGRRLTVERIVPVAARRPGRDRVEIEVALDSAGAIPPVPVADGDIVRVPVIAARVRGRITVAGQVWHPGPQGYSDGMTLTDALRRAGGLQPDGYLPVVHIARLLPDSTRRQLRSALVDTTGATAEPVRLAEDDEITVYSRTEFRPDRYVAIVGAVRRGGRFPWRAGMTLRDLVVMAQGLQESADLRDAEVARVPASRTPDIAAITLRVPLDSSFRLEDPRPVRTPDVLLEPYDNVLIRQDPNFQPPRIVMITGEVASPGAYALTGRETRLSDVLTRAGGLTPWADPRAAYFSRIDLEPLPEEDEELGDSLQLADGGKAARSAPRPRGGVATGAEGRVGINANRSPRGNARRPAIALRQPSGLLRGQPAGLDTIPGRDSLMAEDSLPMAPLRYRVGVDLEQALRRSGSVHDLVLEAGDSLDVPGRRLVVRVTGAVNYPTAHAYEGRKSLGFYIRAAGGVTDRARERAAYVVQPNGRVESRRRLLGLITRDPVPAPGATVVVPERSNTASGSQVTAGITLVAQLIASLAALVALSR